MPDAWAGPTDEQLESFYDRATDNIQDEGDTLPPPWERSEA
jgi:hypothetical protein